MTPGAPPRRPWLARHALGLWFLGIAALGFLRWWQKTGSDPSAAQAPDVVLWLGRLDRNDRDRAGGVMAWPLTLPVSLRKPACHPRRWPAR